MTLSLIRQLAPRACRRSLLHIPIPSISRRCLAIDVDSSTSSSEAALAQRLRIAAANEEPSAQEDGHPPEPRRRRRRKGEPPLDPIVDSYLAFQHMKNTTAQLGSDFTPGYQPHTLLSSPPSPSEISLELLMASQSHLGHSTSLWNPANSRYIFGIRSGIHIISLDITAQYLRRASRIVSQVAERGGLILFVGTRPGFDRCVVRAAQLAAPACHLFERWTPGGITNGQQILGRSRLKLVDEHDNEVPGFDEQLYGVRAMRPDLVVCLNPLECKVLLHECALATIPTIGVIDTDADPTSVTYPIPANDDSIRCIQVIAGTLGRAGEEGQLRRKQRAAQGNIPYPPPQGITIPEDFDISGWRERRAAAAGLAGQLDKPEQHDDSANADAGAAETEAARTAQLMDAMTSEQLKPSAAEDGGADSDSDAESFISHLRAVLSPLELSALQGGGPIDPAALESVRAKLSRDDFETLSGALGLSGGGGGGGDFNMGREEEELYEDREEHVAGQDEGVDDAVDGEDAGGMQMGYNVSADRQPGDEVESNEEAASGRGKRAARRSRGGGDEDDE